MGIIRDKALKSAINNQLRTSKELINEGRIVIENQFKIAHKKLMSSFNSHPVTVELKRGADSSNVSGSLPEGNLFGFIGFESGDDPLAQVEILLSRANILIKNRKLGSFGFIWTYAVNIPTLSELYKVTPLPWAKGASWLQQLEGRGIANLGQYMFTQSPPAGRSKAGIQSGRKSGGTLRIKYIKPLLEDFEENLNNMSGATRISKSYF
jgi:hypothetical protein